MVDLVPAVADEVPEADSPTLTAYDRTHLKTYLRLLDAAAANADWREQAAIVLQRDPNAEPTRRCWETHLQRAQWITAHGYQELLRGKVTNRL